MTSLACLLALTFAAGLGGGQGAPRPLEVAIQDDALMLHGSAASVDRAARRMAAAGADRVRLTAGWSALAPEPRSRRRPEFDASEPGAYPAEPFERLDRAVKAAERHGMEPMIDIAFWAPRWAVSRPLRRGLPTRQRWEPSAREYGRFAEALARRYDGDHPNPANPRGELPAVRLWTTWNEPNHYGFLLPQWRRTRDGRWEAASPHIYRELHNAAYESLKRVDPRNRVLVGGLSSHGDSGRGPRVSMPPLRFTRELACVDLQLKPLRRRECRDYEPLRADGFAIHPYSLETTPDASNTRNLDTVQLGDLDRLSSLLDRLHERGRLAQELPLHITEYGYESNPPDTRRGVSPEDQARFLGQATFLAWQRGDVGMFGQFLLEDIGPGSRSFQSGLYFHDGEPKPALRGFRMPFWAEAREVDGRPFVLAFGQVRPGSGRQAMRLEARGADGSWHEVQSLEVGRAGDLSCSSEARAFLTDEAGFYLRFLPYSGDVTYRPSWRRDDGVIEHGVPVTVGEPVPVDG